MGTSVFLNGKITDLDKAFIPVTDRGFLYGDGIFETIRFYKKTPFQLRLHLKRLEYSAEQIKIKTDIAMIAEGCSQVINNNHLDDGILRVTVSRGVSANRTLTEQGLTPSLLIQAHPLPRFPEGFYDKGVKAITLQDGRNEICNVKNTNLLPNIVSKFRAEEEGAFEAILISKRGFVTEGLTSNVFGLIEGTLITPPAGKKVLNGTTRQLVIKIARELGIRTEEDALMGNELSLVSELFLTNSVIQILPVVQLDSNAIGQGTIGPTTSSLLNAFKTVVSNWLKTT